jgi:cell wall-associated NlpC family hydrolase
MTIKEIEHTDYVSSFVGVPYKWKGRDKVEGMDCRTLISEFLSGLGYDFDGEDGLPIPTEEEYKQILQDKAKSRGLIRRYINGLKNRGQQVDVADIRQNDIVVYTAEEFIHVGVYVCENKILTASKEHGSFLKKLSIIKDSIITIARLAK